MYKAQVWKDAGTHTSMEGCRYTQVWHDAGTHTCCKLFDHAVKLPDSGFRYHTQAWKDTGTHKYVRMQVPHTFCRLFDHAVKTQIVLIKLALDQGAGPVTNWLELAIESMKDPAI